MIFSNMLRNRLEKLNPAHEKRFVTELTVYQQNEIKTRSYCDELNSIYGYTFDVLGSTEYDKAIYKGVVSSPLEKDLENMSNLANALHVYYGSNAHTEGV